MNTRSRRWGGRRAAASPLPVLVAVLALSGCSAHGQQIDLAPRSSVSTAERSAGEALPASAPAWLDVPDIGARSTLLPLGLNDDRTVAVPSVHEPMQAGWYRYGPTPGETGPAVVLGHVNGDGRDGIFARLHQLVPGAEVRVGRSDGTVARFTVTRIDQVPKDRFPADEVYGDTTTPELRLITCGGAFDDAAGSYRDNIIAYAGLTGVVP